MYTGATFDSSGEFYSVQYESLTYLGGWEGVGRSIRDRMSYRNHYMCSCEATSMKKNNTHSVGKTSFFSFFYGYKNQNISCKFLLLS